MTNYGNVKVKRTISSDVGLNGSYVFGKFFTKALANGELTVEGQLPPQDVPLIIHNFAGRNETAVRGETILIYRDSIGNNHLRNKIQEYVGEWVHSDHVFVVPSLGKTNGLHANHLPVLENDIMSVSVLWERVDHV